MSKVIVYATPDGLTIYKPNPKNRRESEAEDEFHLRLWREEVSKLTDIATIEAYLVEAGDRLPPREQRLAWFSEMKKVSPRIQ